MATQTLSKGSGDVTRQISNIFALGTVLTINALANILPINGQTTGEISDSFNSLVTPAGYVFSIWGVIYALLAAFAVYQALPSQKDNPRLQNLGYAFVWSCVFNFAWIIVWHYNLYALSLLCMFGILASLIACYQRLGIGQSEVSRTEYLTTRLPFSIYLGWITAATILNITVVLLSFGITGGAAAPVLGAVVVLAALSIALTVLVRRNDLAYALVLVWAFVGIAVAEQGITPLVVGVSLLCAAVLAAAIVWRGMTRRQTAVIRRTEGSSASRK